MPAQVYLDSAATTHKHAQVLDVMAQYHTYTNATVHRSAYQIANQATELFEESRTKVAQLINTKSSDQIVFTSGATESINTIANGVHGEMISGNKILIMASEHHANILPWQVLANKMNLKIEIIKLAADGTFSQLEFDRLVNQLTSDVAILALAHVSNALGNIYPVKEICDIAEQHDILTIVDGTQAIAHLPVDVQSMGCDFYVFSGHKMYAPTGVGVMYGKQSLLEALRPSKLGGEMITHVSFEHAEFQAPPLKFEGGTPNIAGVIGLGVAAEFIKCNLDAIMQHEKALYSQLITGLKKFDSIRVVGNITDSIGLVSMISQKHHVNDIALLLFQKNIAVRVGHHCAMPLMEYLAISGTLRVSIGSYNTEQDILIFLQTLANALALLDERETAGETVNENLKANAKINKNVGGNKALSQTTALPIAQNILNASGWDNQYRQLLLASKSLDVLPSELRNNESAVIGCESDLWIEMHKGAVCAYSQSKIIRGILALLIEKSNALMNVDTQTQGGRPDEDVAIKFDYYSYLSELNLTPYFSVGRRDGVKNAINAIKALMVRKN